MKVQRWVIGLTVVNLGILVFVLARAGAGGEQGVAAVLRGRAIELVDEHGQVRAQMNVEPGGEAVFRLRGEKGTIRVKLGASEEGSGLLLLDETTEPRVHILAKRTGTTVTLSGKNGEQRVIRP